MLYAEVIGEDGEQLGVAEVRVTTIANKFSTQLIWIGIATNRGVLQRYHCIDPMLP